MTRNSSNQDKKIFDLNSVGSYISKTVPNYLTTVLLLTLVFQGYSTIVSKDYWIFISTNIIDIGNAFLSLFAYSQDYFIANLALVLILIWIVNLFKPKSWIEKTKYSQKEQSSFYVSQLIKQGAKIQDEHELLVFCQDTVDILHNIFAHKSSINNTTWLIPKGRQLVLFCNNTSSKYNKEDTHYSFYGEEGVVGNSWATGKIEYYSEKQENKYYKNRLQCSDKAYICCPVIQEPLNKYGIISVGSDENIFWDGEDIESLKLISTVVLKILNDLDDGIKTQFNLQTLQR
jgi:hypothetical protein